MVSSLQKAPLIRLTRLTKVAWSFWKALGTAVENMLQVEHFLHACLPISWTSRPIVSLKKFLPNCFFQRINPQHRLYRQVAASQAIMAHGINVALLNAMQISQYLLRVYRVHFHMVPRAALLTRTNFFAKVKQREKTTRFNLTERIIIPERFQLFPIAILRECTLTT